MTFLQLYGEALNIELASSSTELFTTLRRKKAINDAQDHFARLTGCTKRYATIAVVDGTEEYDLETAITALDYIRLAGSPSLRMTKTLTGDVRYVQGPLDFPQREPEELDRVEPGWRSAPDGTPQFWYTREDGGATYLGVNPGPDIPTGYTWDLIVPYVADPADMTGDSDEPFTFSTDVIKRLRPYHQALAHYGAAQLEPARKNYSGVTRQMQIYSSFVAQFLQQRTEDGANQIGVLRDYYGDGRRGQRPGDPRR